jgi:hypothetical protein
MSENVLNILINAGTSLLSSIVTAIFTYIISKKSEERALRHQFKTHKLAVFELFVSSFAEISLVYAQKPFNIISAINNVLLYLDDTKRAPFIELRNALDVATEQDIEMLKTKFDNCVAVLQEEVK